MCARHRLLGRPPRAGRWLLLLFLPPRAPLCPGWRCYSPTFFKMFTYGLRQAFRVVLTFAHFAVCLQILVTEHFGTTSPRAPNTGLPCSPQVAPRAAWRVGRVPTRPETTRTLRCRLCLRRADVRPRFPRLPRSGSPALADTRGLCPLQAVPAPTVRRNPGPPRRAGAEPPRPAGPGTLPGRPGPRRLPPGSPCSLPFLWLCPLRFLLFPCPLPWSSQSDCRGFWCSAFSAGSLRSVWTS